jgi:hypothetical protein
MTDYLFDTPYWLLALVAVIGVAVLVSANARQDKRLGGVGAGVLALGLVLLLVSYFVQTDKEKVLGRTRELVAAVEKKDTAAMDKLLHPGAQIAGTELGKAQILAMAPQKVDQYRLSNIKSSREELVQRSKAVIEVSATVTANADGVGMGNTPTDWQFIWVNTPDGWRVREIRPLKFSIGNVDLQSLISQRLR